MLAAVGLSVACSPPPPPPFVPQRDLGEVLLSSRCDIDLRCECPNTAFEDDEGCREARAVRIDDSIMVAEANELHYDGVCVGTLLELREAAGCTSALELEEPEERCLEPCKPFHGEVAEGEECNKLGITVDVDDCAQGLRCVAAVCVPLCDLKPALEEGEACRAGIVELGVCAPSLHCNEEGECARAADIGSACDEVPCMQTAFCDLTSTPASCAAKRDADEVCNAPGDCRSDTCADGRCAEVTPLACEP